MIILNNKVRVFDNTKAFKVKVLKIMKSKFNQGLPWSVPGGVVGDYVEVKITKVVGEDDSETICVGAIFDGLIVNVKGIILLSDLGDPVGTRLHSLDLKRLWEQDQFKVVSLGKKK